jgi:hypothetical protein
VILTSGYNVRDTILNNFFECVCVSLCVCVCLCVERVSVCGCETDCVWKTYFKQTAIEAHGKKYMEFRDSETFLKQIQRHSDMAAIIKF